MSIELKAEDEDILKQKLYTIAYRYYTQIYKKAT